jgi:predicted Rossmann fold nucleotide-binding protein DprA/Smf involved in DNA uptake
MKLAIVGSRSITDKNVVLEQVNLAMEKYGGVDDAIVILSGGAKGVDTVAREVAYDMGCDFVLFKPYHMLDSTVEYTPKYFFTRNKQIADNADVVVIVWDGKSNGTRHMVDYCKKHKKPFILYDGSATE